MAISRPGYANPPKIYFFLATRVMGDADFAAVVRWAQTAAQVVDAVGIYCYEPVGGSYTTYRRRAGVPTNLKLERVLYRACIDLRGLAAAGLSKPLPGKVPQSPAADAAVTSPEAAEDAGHN